MASSDADLSRKFKSSFGKVIDNVNDGAGSENSVSPSMENMTQFQHWAKIMVSFLDDNSVIFACYKDSKFGRIQLGDIVALLKEIDYFDSVNAINYLPQPNFVKIEFDSVSMVEIFMDTVSELNGLPIKFVVKGDLINTCVFSIANLPPNLFRKFVEPQLKFCGEVIRLSPQLIPKRNGGNVQIGSIKVDFKFCDGKGIEDLPYFVKVLGLKVFINVRGRQRICFRCSGKDHLVAECGLRFCGLCRGLRRVEHSCLRSFASVVKNDNVMALKEDLQDSILEELEEGDKEMGIVENDLREIDGVQNSESGISNKVEESLLVKEVTIEGVAKVPAVENVKRMRTRSLTRSDDNCEKFQIVRAKKLIKLGQEGRVEKNKRVKIEKCADGKEKKKRNKRGANHSSGSEEGSEAGGKGEPAFSALEGAEIGDESFHDSLDSVEVSLNEEHKLDCSEQEEADETSGIANANTGIERE